MRKNAYGPRVEGEAVGVPSELSEHANEISRVKEMSEMSDILRM